MSYIGNSPAASPTNKIEKGDSSVEVIDTGTGLIEFTTDGTKVAEIDASGNMKFDSGYGSAETVYGCRAWVNFNGTGTVAIRESGNVSSITDNGTGDYTVNFTNAMPDANYCVSSTSTKFATGTSGRRQADCVNPRERTASNFVVIITASSDGSDQDAEIIDLSVFR